MSAKESCSENVVHGAVEFDCFSRSLIIAFSALHTLAPPFLSEFRISLPGPRNIIPASIGRMKPATHLGEGR